MNILLAPTYQIGEYWKDRMGVPIDKVITTVRELHGLSDHVFYIFGDVHNWLYQANNKEYETWYELLYYARMRRNCKVKE